RGPPVLRENAAEEEMRFAVSRILLENALRGARSTLPIALGKEIPCGIERTPLLRQHHRARETPQYPSHRGASAPPRLRVTNFFSVPHLPGPNFWLPLMPAPSFTEMS